MKALTLFQPWATFLQIGIKTVETRSWNTTYRGSVLIHASQRITPQGRAIYRKIVDILGNEGDIPSFESLPRGVILCQVRLDQICRTEEMLRSQRMTFLERSLGDYTPGRFAWVLTFLEKYEPPLPARGRPGLWEFDERNV